MVKTSARRSKRRSTRQEAKAPSSFPTAALIAVLFLISVPLDLFNTDWLLAEHDETSQRRFLLDHNHHGGEQVLDIGLEENVWKRQLRVRETGGKKSMAEDIAGYGRRMPIIPRYEDKHHFDECAGVTVEECQLLIDAYVTTHPEEFNDQATLLLDIRKIREWTDDSYYKVVLRTNLDGSEVYGIFDDGLVYYPWPWRVAGEDKTIGPWNCSGRDGAYLSPSDCCQMIQADVTWQDDNQHYLACFVEEPVGGARNPAREDRVIVVTNGEGEVVGSPVAH